MLKNFLTIEKIDFDQRELLLNRMFQLTIILIFIKINIIILIKDKKFMSLDVTFQSHVRNCFNHMAFPHLVMQYAQNNKETMCVVERVYSTLLCKAIQKAEESQQQTLEAGGVFDHAQAIQEQHPGKIMRLMTKVVGKFIDQLPQGYVSMLRNVAQNHLTRVSTPEENWHAVINGAVLERAQPTYPQNQVFLGLVSGAPGVGKSTYPSSVVGQFIDTATDTYSNLLAEYAVQKGWVDQHPDLYRIGGAEGSIIKRMFQEELNERLKQRGELPHVVIASVKIYGSELQGFFWSEMPRAFVALIFCSEKTVVQHMEERQQQGLHHSPLQSIQSGLHDASNQLFSSATLEEPYQAKYRSVIHYLRENCRDHRKQVVVDLISTDVVAEQQQLETRRTPDGKAFAVVGQIAIDRNGSAELRMPANLSALNQFLEQSHHTILDLLQQLA